MLLAGRGEDLIRYLSLFKGKRRFGGGGKIFLGSLFIVISLVSACREETADGLPPAPLKRTRVLEFNEKILLKAIVDVLKEKGFENPKVDRDKGKVETDFFVHEDFRTKVEAMVKKISRKEGEVTLSVITEVKSSGEWKEKQILDRGQYDKFFDEIEMQAYRELAKAE